MVGRGFTLAAAMGMATGAALLGRAVRALDRADIDLDLNKSSFAFPTGLRTEVAATDGAVITTETAGTGPIVVLVHGITSSNQDWGPVAHLLVERGHTVVGVDQRGHGDSTSGTAGYSPARLGDDLAEVLTALDLRDVVLTGHSMGGIAAISFALNHPEVCSERVSSLVLVATTPRIPALLQRPQTRLVTTALGRAKFDPAIRRPALARALFGRFGSRGLTDAARASALRADPRNVAECAAGIAGYDVTDRLQSIVVPTRCIYGTQDLVTPPAANRKIARSIPGATAREIPGAGHLLIWTHPEAIVEQIAP